MKKKSSYFTTRVFKTSRTKKNNEDEVSQDDNIDLTKVLETNDGLDEETLPSDLEKSIQNILKKK